MLKRVLLVGFLAVGGVLVGACSAEPSNDDPGYSEDDITQALVIKENQNGKTFNVAKGKDIRVRLGSNPTTGYSWKVVSTSRTFGYPTPKDGDFEGGGAGGPVGAGGTQVFLWKTNAPLLRPSGTAHTVKLEYRRSFESDETPAAKTFTFKIKIKDGPVLPPPDTGAPVVLEASNDGDTVTAKEGQKVQVKLEAQPAAGYQWHVTSTNRTFAYPSVEHASNGPPGAVGAPTTQTLTWETTNKIGTHAVKLKYARGENGEATKEFSFTVKVVEAVSPEIEFECPPSSMKTINCMPIVPASRAKYCKADYRSWAQDNCDVSYVF